MEKGRPLLVLDIDETLISSQERELDYPASYRLGKFFVYLRPHLKSFLTDVAVNFDTSYWSSGSPDYVHTLTGWFTDLAAVEPLFVWDSTRCTPRRDFTHQEWYHLKDLKKLKRKGFQLSRVLIVEDEPRKVGRNYGNAIYVKPYNGEREDVELPLLAAYLAQIKNTSDFRTIEKRSWRSNTQTITSD